MRHLSRDNQYFFYMLFFILFYLSFQLLQPLFSLITFTLLIAMFSQPMYKWFLNLTRKKSGISTMLTMLVALFFLSIPILFLSTIVVNQVSIFITDISKFAGIQVELPSNSQEVGSYLPYKATDSIGDINIEKIISQINSYFDGIPLLDFKISVDQVRGFAGQVAILSAQFIGTFAFGLAINAPGFLTQLVLFFILLPTLIANLDKLKYFIMKLSPLDNDIDNIYFRKVKAMSVSMVRGTFVIALVAGGICGILLWIANVPYLGFWTLISTLLSLIPLGAGIVQWPIAIAVLLSGNVFGAVIIMLGNMFIISNIDNILRPHLVSSEAHLNPALILLSFVGGLNVFGPLGFIYGPVIMILLITTFDIYTNYYKEGKHD